MVVFTCAHCGDSVQKPKVEKHYETKCRGNFPDLCCMDCLKDFRGDEFNVHTKCISEAERYGAKGFVAKPSQNKGEKKQDAWIEICQSVLDEHTNISKPVRNLLERVSKQPNTPRKKPKFLNFVKSMDHRMNLNHIEEAWNLLSSKLDLLKAPNTVKDDGDATKTNGHSDVDNSSKTNGDVVNEKENGDTCEPTKKKKKNKTDENVSEENATEKEDVSNDNSADSAAKVEEKTLTKKERKELKKKKKYEAEFNEVLNAAPKSAVEDEEISTNKKSKKRKLCEPDDKDKKEQTEENKSNKQVTLQLSEEKVEPSNKKSKKDDATSFDWVGAITSVLGTKGKEISLKKLQKKVLTEYCAINNTEEITERISKKYLKSLYKMQNVKIECDKISILEVEG